MRSIRKMDGASEYRSHIPQLFLHAHGVRQLRIVELLIGADNLNIPLDAALVDAEALRFLRFADDLPVAEALIKVKDTDVFEGLLSYEAGPPFIPKGTVLRLRRGLATCGYP